MKKWMKLLSLFFALIVSVTIFSACNSDNDLSIGQEPPKEIIQPTEMKVSGYSNEITVGDNYITKLKVEQKIDGTWYQVPQAEYVVSCAYDGYKYGEYSFNVYLKEYANVEYSDTIKVNPKTMDIPESYSVSYTGELVDIKTYYETLAEGNYKVVSYENRSDIGDYIVELKLTNSDMFVWAYEDGSITKNPTITINWSITE